MTTKTTPENPPALDDVLKHARPYADALAKLNDKVQELTDEQKKLQRQHLRGIRDAANCLAELRSRLSDALHAAASHFTEPSPRTITVFGLKLGFRKNIGSVDYKDAESVLTRIDRLMPNRLDELAPQVRILDKKALGKLTAAELKSIGCSLVNTGDELVIKSAITDVEKLVERLIKDAGEEGVAS